MNNNRLGCLSPSAIVASIITLLIIAGAGLFNGSGFFSAGALNARAGANLGGVSSHAEIGNDCAKCHSAPWSSTTQAELCQACHVDITQQLAKPDSLHSLMLKDEKIACRACHPDHRGRNAPLTELQSNIFPHEGTGYSLNSHQKRSDGQAFVCSDCHAGDITRFDRAVCSTCHEHVNKVFVASHTQAYGTDCMACHDGKESIGKNFDHTLAAFKLEGEHAGPACADCHAKARTSADFKSAPVECFACHAKDDDHEGALGKNCGDCHNVSGWEPATFDHNGSVFKLEGKHAEVECADCHINNVFKGTDVSCFSCHQKDDDHKGEFGQDCGTCHKAAGWEPATFDHNLSAFKLEGEHAEVKCTDCHINNVFKGTDSACFSCHQKDDSHKGKFGQECGACHSVKGWKPATFDHNLSAFRLNGGHANVACEKCHINNVFKGTSQTCSSCHYNPAFHSGLFTSSPCSECHNVNSWSSAKYSGPHPGIADEGGRGVNHGGKGCRSCHTVNLNTATCTQCHKNGKPDGD